MRLDAGKCGEGERRSLQCRKSDACLNLPTLRPLFRIVQLGDHLLLQRDIAAMRAARQSIAVTYARAFLIDSLRHVVDGGDITNDALDGAIPDPAALSGAERKAWQGLSYWADDDDIRARKPAYAPMRRQQLRDLLDNLERE